MTKSSTTDKKDRPKPFLFPQFCKACGRCIEACPSNCIDYADFRGRPNSLRGYAFTRSHRTVTRAGVFQRPHHCCADGYNVSALQSRCLDGRGC